MVMDQSSMVKFHNILPLCFIL